MSASSKKKLRKEQNAANLTEKQLQEQKETKKLKTYTTTFIVAMALVVAIVLGIVLRTPVITLLDSNTIAVTIGEHKLNTVQLGYFYADTISEYYKGFTDAYGDYAYLYASLSGLDVSMPLNKQEHPDEECTWAEYFMDDAIENAKKVYTLYDMAMAAGHKLTETEETTMKNAIDTVELYAKYYYGFSNLESYLRANYGLSASLDTYKEYYRISSIASSFSNAYADKLEYKDEDYRAYEKDKFYNYSSFTYASYYIAVNDYRGEGTKNEQTGAITYTDEQMEAARAAAKADMEALMKGEYEKVEDFDKAIAALKINASKNNVASTKYKNLLNNENNISNEDLRKWLAQEHKVGDMTQIEMTSETDGKKEVTGYYVIYLQDFNDNHMKLVNVRHVLMKFEGGKTDSNGNKIYTDAEKAAAEQQATNMLLMWKEGGDVSAESFGEFAKESSTDSSAANGGLIEDIYPGQMVTEFNDWCFDEKRQPGDTGVVITQHGAHIMYFESYDEFTFRDYMINAELVNEAVEKWVEDNTKNVTAVEGDLSRMNWERSVM